MKKKIIHNEILRHKVEVTIADGDKEFDKAIKDLNKIKDINCDWTHKDVAWLFSRSEDTWRWYITMNWFNIPEISHEVVHLIFRLFEDSWIPFNINNDEVFAYHMWYYITEILAMQPKAKANTKKI